jgi:hypothetical protein
MFRTSLLHSGQPTMTGVFIDKIRGSARRKKRAPVGALYRIVSLQMRTTLISIASKTGPLRG